MIFSYSIIIIFIYSIYIQKNQVTIIISHIIYYKHSQFFSILNLSILDVKYVCRRWYKFCCFLWWHNRMIEKSSQGALIFYGIFVMNILLGQTYKFDSNYYPKWVSIHYYFARFNIHFKITHPKAWYKCSESWIQFPCCVFRSC